MHDPANGLRRIPLMRLSEKGRKSLQCSLTEHRNGSFRPILASLRFPNPRSEYLSYPFSDSLYVKLVHRERPGPLRKVGAHARRKGALSVYFFGLARFAAQLIVGVVVGVSEDPIKARSLVNNRVRKTSAA
jgi:hypothetical protein